MLGLTNMKVVSVICRSCSIINAVVCARFLATLEMTQRLDFYWFIQIA